MRYGNSTQQLLHKVNVAWNNCFRKKIKLSMNGVWLTFRSYFLGGAAVGRRTRDRKVAGSTPGRGAIKSSIRQLSLPSLWGRNRVPACLAGVKAGCVHLCRVASNTV